MESVYRPRRNKIGKNGVVVWEENLKCFVRFSHPVHNHKFGQIASLGSFSNDDGNGNENVISKHVFALLQLTREYSKLFNVTKV